MPAKCFKPAPKVKSCLLEFRIKNAECRIERDKFVEFLELFAPFSRKTLGAIQTMLHKRSAINAPGGRDKMMKIEIPEALKKKRLEELTWENIEHIFA
ncbi:MAG: hypothetical protein WCH65_06865 [bacterium]